MGKLPGLRLQVRLCFLQTSGAEGNENFLDGKIAKVSESSYPGQLG